MRDEVVYPQRRKKDPLMAPVAVMVAAERDLTAVRHCLAVPGRPSWRILTSKLYQREDREAVAVVGPMCGAPYAVMVLEELIFSGAKKIIYLGWCGSIQMHLRIGDLLLPDSAVSEEGTSAHYPLRPPCFKPSGLVFEALEESLAASSVCFRRGPVWSTDAPYRETKEKIMAYQRQGVLGVEMELSALFAAARFRKVDLGALLVVSDELGSLCWKRGFSHPRFKSSRKIAARVMPTAYRKLFRQCP
jgi:uridine phosphorylase